MSRYRVPDLPRQGAGAFLPPVPPGRPVAEVSSWGLVHVSGAPGTMPVPAPKPTVLDSGVSTSADRKTMPSFVAPEVILPSVYVASARNMGPREGALGVRVRSTEDIPVPATNIIAVAAVAQRAPTKLGGRRVTPWPRVIQRWPSVTQPSATGRALW